MGKVRPVVEMMKCGSPPSSSRKELQQGYVLMATLFFSILLLMGIMGTLKLSQTQVGGVAGIHDKVAAQYAAESGLQDVVHKLVATNGAWLGGEDFPLAQGEATYSVRFVEPEDATGLLSVNNLLSSVAVTTADGREIPPKTALIFIEGRSGRKTATLEALLQSDTLGRVANDIIIAGSSIEIEDDCDVKYIDSTVFSGEKRPVGIQLLNKYNDSHFELESDTFNLPGSVSVVRGDENSIGSKAWGLLGGESFEFPDEPSPIPFDLLDIEYLILQKKAMAEPVDYIGGNLSLASEDYVYTGDLTVNGDLDLQGANLYVEGDLVVLGSVQGEGSLFTSGEIQFKGSSELSFSEDLQFSIFSEGDITIEGYDAKAYLESHQTSQYYFDELNRALGDMDALLGKVLEYDVEKQGDALYKEVDEGLTRAEQLDRLRRVIAGTGDRSLPFANGYSGFDMSGKMVRSLGTLQPSETRDFLIERYQSIRDIFSYANTSLGNQQEILEDWGKGLIPGGSLDLLFDENGSLTYRLETVLQQGRGITQACLTDRPANSFFTGLLYSRGNIRCDNELTVIGALIAPGSSEGTGKVFLGNYSRLIYIEDSLVGNTNIMTNLRALTWRFVN